MALDGATPTMFGPKPLNSALEPSVSTINLLNEKDRIVKIAMLAISHVNG